MWYATCLTRSACEQRSGCHSLTMHSVIGMPCRVYRHCSSGGRVCGGCSGVKPPKRERQGVREKLGTSHLLLLPL